MYMELSYRKYTEFMKIHGREAIHKATCLEYSSFFFILTNISTMNTNLQISFQFCTLWEKFYGSRRGEY